MLRLMPRTFSWHDMSNIRSLSRVSRRGVRPKALIKAPIPKILTAPTVGAPSKDLTRVQQAYSGKSMVCPNPPLHSLPAALMTCT